MPFYPIMVWSDAGGYRPVPNEAMSEDCEAAKLMAAAVLGKLGEEESLCCHFMDIGRGAFLVWICDEYELLKQFAETEAGRHLRDAVGEIPHPGFRMK